MSSTETSFAVHCSKTWDVSFGPAVDPRGECMGPSSPLVLLCWHSHRWIPQGWMPSYLRVLTHFEGSSFWFPIQLFKLTEILGLPWNASSPYNPEISCWASSEQFWNKIILKNFFYLPGDFEAILPSLRVHSTQGVVLVTGTRSHTGYLWFAGSSQITDILVATDLTQAVLLY